MSIRGRKPTPVETKIVMGNPGRRPLTTAVPKPPRGPLVCPPEVADDAKALEYWRHYTSTTARGHLMPVDAPLLAELCSALAALHVARANLRKTGDLVKTPNGNWVYSPFFTMVKSHREAVIKLTSNLSLTVAERNRLGVNDDEADDPTDHYFDA
jgi:P27 family predicted phage terminase small subunit